jgi:hypothetical protein
MKVIKNRDGPCIGKSRGDPPLLFDERGDPGLFQHSRDNPVKEFLNFRNQTGQYHQYGESTAYSEISVQ